MRLARRGSVVRNVRVQVTSTVEALSNRDLALLLVVWGIWVALVHAFLPKKTAVALIEWQRAISRQPGAKDHTDATTSVTA